MGFTVRIFCRGSTVRIFAGVPLRFTTCLWSAAPAGLWGLLIPIVRNFRGEFHRPHFRRGFTARIFAGVPLRSTACLYSARPCGAGGVVNTKCSQFSRGIPPSAFFAGVPLRSTACLYSVRPCGAGGLLRIATQLKYVDAKIQNYHGLCFFRKSSLSSLLNEIGPIAPPSYLKKQ